MADLKMPQLNTVILSGRLLRDPELKTGASGYAYIKTGIAVDDGYGDKKKTYFVDVAAFGKLAERMHPELSKGVPVIVEGRLTVEEWKVEDGSKRSRVVILASRLDRLTWPEKSQYTQEGNNTPRPPQTSPRPAQAAQTPIPEDDIPF
jgi:single-strand DNA-binding protein